MIMRLRLANIRLINRRSLLPRLLLALPSKNGKSNNNDKNNFTDAQGLTGHSISGRIDIYRTDISAAIGTLSAQLAEKQMQVLRLTTPKLKNAWGPFRSG
jgi:hypothetical protein